MYAFRTVQHSNYRLACVAQCQNVSRTESHPKDSIKRRRLCTWHDRLEGTHADRVTIAIRTPDIQTRIEWVYREADIVKSERHVQLDVTGNSIRLSETSYVLELCAWYPAVYRVCDSPKTRQA